MNATIFNIHCSVTWLLTMEPRYNEGPRDWQNVFAIKSFRYIEVHFHMFYYYWEEEYGSLYPRTSLNRSSSKRSSTVQLNYNFCSKKMLCY